jgi:hypothetical protein
MNLWYDASHLNSFVSGWFKIWVWSSGMWPCNMVHRNLLTAKGPGDWGSRLFPFYQTYCFEFQKVCNLKVGTHCNVTACRNRIVTVWTGLETTLRITSWLRGKVRGTLGALSVFGRRINGMIRLRPERVWTCSATRRHLPLLSPSLRSWCFWLP